jgi:hypothetical protein
MLEPTQARLRILLADHFLGIPPFMQRCLVESISELTAGIGRSAVERVADLMSVDANLAEGQGFTDYAACLRSAINELRDVYDSLDEPAESTHRIVGEIYLDFADGEVSGSIEGCNVAEVADALMTIVEELRRMDETPAYIDYDEGKISVGNPTSNEEN